MGRAGDPGPKPRRVPRPPTRVGAGAEGWEGGGTGVWPHLNPFSTRRHPGEPLRGERPPRVLRREPGGRPLFCPAALPPAVRSAAPRAAACGTVSAYPVFVEAAKGMACPLSLLATCGAGGVGCPASAPTPPPQSKYLPQPGLHTKPRGRGRPAPSPLFPVPRPVTARSRPAPPFLSVSGWPAASAPFSASRFSRDPSTGSVLARSYRGSGPASALGHTDSAVSSGLHHSPLFAGFFERHFLRIQMKRLHFLD